MKESAGQLPGTQNAVEALANKLNVKWPSIAAAAKAANVTRQTVADILQQHRMVPPDSSFVVFGSLARDEWTINSDVDWTLLIDGQADPQHLKITQKIAARLKEAKLGEPGPTGTFGNMAFSHGIIQQIGGEEDTNRNTTQRVLLLLESAAIGDAEAYRRVVRLVFNRYLDDDNSLLSGSGAKYKVPRFLLNDIVRYWRTMCVDYASKHREREGQGWALRNAKLRLSRKLIFASGLLTCFSCFLQPPQTTQDLFNGLNSLEPLVAHLLRSVSRTPLEIVADALDRYASDNTARQMMGAYDEFLEMLNDGEKRARLKELKSREANTDPVFKEVKRISAAFQGGLTALFFDDHPQLTELTRKYGLF
jgi:predicted nucleotidyltransferase